MKIIAFDRRLFQYLATISGALAAITAGMTSGWPSPYLPVLLESTEVPTTGTEASWCAVMPLLGVMPGALVGILIVDRIGRKTSVLAITPFMIASFLVIAFARSIHLIWIARFIIGAYEGAFYTSMPIYLAEISDPEVRGLLHSTLSIAALVGILLINVIGPLTSIFTSSLISAAICAVHVCTFAWMPESPYYYVKRGKKDEARTSLKILRMSSDVEEELAAVYAAVLRQESKGTAKFTDLFTVRSNRKAVIIYIVLALTNRFSGKNPIVYYTTIIFRTAEVELDPSLSVIIYYVVGILAAISALFVIDKFGRRRLMLFSAAGCSVSLAAEGLYFFLKEHSSWNMAYLNWLPLTALISYSIIFCFGLNFGPLLLLSELFPINIKAKASGLGDSFLAISGVITAQFFFVVNDQFGMYVPFWTFSLCSLLGLICIYYCLIETKGKSLEQIQLELIKL